MRNLLPFGLVLLGSCTTTALPASPIAGAWSVDHLIQENEEHFAHLWQLTAGGENAEGYWSFGGDRIVFQRTDESAGMPCDRIFTMPVAGESRADPAAFHADPPLHAVSDGRGVTTCAYFLPGDQEVVFASTGAHMEGCPERPDFSLGYVWAIRPEYDLFVHDLARGEARALTNEWGYDAEATVSPTGDRMVFTSTRSGDLELWTCALDGSDPYQVTDTLGYDGGAFFSNDGKQLVFRTTAFTPGKEVEEHAAYRELLDNWTVRPHSMEIMLIDADGSNRRRLTHLGNANFAPFFYPDDSRVIFSTNHHEESARNFDLFSIGVDGEELERITTYEGFDSFPQFSPDGRYLVFASNRGGTTPGETNLFVALWR